MFKNNKAATLTGEEIQLLKTAILDYQSTLKEEGAKVSKISLIARNELIRKSNLMGNILRKLEAIE